MRISRIITLCAVLGLTAAACSTTDEPAAASITITSPAEGDTVGGNVVSLALDAAGIDIVAPDGDDSGDTGHFHVFIDRDPVATGEVVEREAGIVHSASNPVVISGLTEGEHTFTVVFGDGTHTRITDAEASVTVTLEGPTVQASAAVDGSTVTVDATVSGVELVVDPPSAEHLHYFLDVEPTFDGPISTDDPAIVHSRETSATFADVAAGDHTVWVVLADGEHVPLDPPVYAVVTLTV